MGLFSDGNGTGAGALFLKKKKKKLLAHGTLLHFTSNITLTAATESVFGNGRVGGPGQLHL